MFFKALMMNILKLVATIVVFIIASIGVGKITEFIVASKELHSKFSFNSIFDYFTVGVEVSFLVGMFAFSIYLGFQLLWIIVKPEEKQIDCPYEF